MSTLGEQYPYTLIESDDPTKTLGEGEMSDYRTLRAAATALVHSKAKYKQIVYDDDTTARELTDREERFVTLIAAMHGWDLEEVDGHAPRVP